MIIRRTKAAWAALATSALLLSGLSAPAHAEECDECEESHGWHRVVDWCRDHTPHRRHCHGCRHCRGHHGGGYYGGAYGGYGSGYGSGTWNSLNGGYGDPRDTALYAAQGYNVPVAVPLAPIVKHTYNYGWGVPSSRLTRVGAQYTQWYPNVPYSQTGGQLPGQYPVYQPTDTTQQGAYYVHVPRWGRYPAY